MDLCLFEFSLLLLSLLGWKNTETTSLPEELQNLYTGCYGTHYFQPRCENDDTVIAVLDTKVGAKPLDTLCPAIVVRVSGELVDADNYSIVVNESYCCTPNFETDCIFSKVHDAYIYQLRCTGLTNCSSSSPVFWNQTDNSSCSSPERGPYLMTTNYMYMEYYCIQKTRIATMTDNVSRSVTSPYYLQNPGYPVNITSGSENVTCSLTSQTCALIFFYTIDIRLVDENGVCKQHLSVSTGDQTIFEWDCDDELYFNITNQTIGYNHVTVRFENQNAADGGNFWIEFQSSDGSELLLDCPATTLDAMSCQNSNITSSTSMSSQNRDSKNVIPIIAGVVVAVIMAVLGVLILLWYCVFRKRKPTKSDTPDSDRKTLRNEGESQTLQSGSEQGNLQTGDSQGILLNEAAQENPPSGGIYVPDTLINNDSFALTDLRQRPPERISFPSEEPPSVRNHQLPPIQQQSTTEKSEDDEKRMKRKRKKKKKRERKANSDLEESKTETGEKKESASDLTKVSVS